MELPRLEPLHQQYRDQGLRIVAIDGMADTDRSRKFIDDHGLSYTFLENGEGEDDVAGGRPTLIHSLSVRQTRVFLLLGYSLSIGGYLVAGLPILLAAPVLGLCLIPLLKSDSTPRFTDLLLLWPGLTVLITAGWN